jgi:hypothetical protein
MVIMMMMIRHERERGMVQERINRNGKWNDTEVCTKTYYIYILKDGYNETYQTL